MVLFVYGTLKRGCRNHGRLSGSPFICSAWTKPLYRMYNCGTHPGLVAAGDGESVQGELYRVRSDVISRLDVFEGDGYHRMPIELIEGVDGAVGYLYTGDISDLSPCGPVWFDAKCS